MALYPPPKQPPPLEPKQQGYPAPVPDPEPPPPIEDGPVWALAGGALAYWVMYGSGKSTLRSIFRTVWSRPTHWLGRAFRHFVPNPASLETTIEHNLFSVLGSQMVHATPHFARWMHKQARVFEQMTGVIMATAEWTHDALRILRHETIPHLLYDLETKIAKAINILDDRLTTVEGRIARSTGYINAMLRGLPWGTATTFDLSIRQWAGAFSHLWDQMVHHVQPALNDLLTRRIPLLEDQVRSILTDLYRTGINSLDGLRQRVRNLEDEINPILSNPLTWILSFLGTAAGIAALQNIFARANPNLVCDETTAFTEDLCAQPAGTGHNWAKILEELGAFALGSLILVDPTEVATASGAVLDVLDPGIAWMAGLNTESFAAAEAEVVGAVASYLGLP